MIRLAGLLLLVTGCVARNQVVEAFPPAESASPWILQGEVWHGTFAAAAPGLGDDAQRWAHFEPTHAWLAVYCHEQQPEKCLKVRLFAFASQEAAARAYEAFRPANPTAYEIGDQGCWTEIGVLFQWGRLVCDVFGDRADWNAQVNASLLAAYLGRRMPPEAPGNPQ